MTQPTCPLPWRIRRTRNGIWVIMRWVSWAGTYVTAQMYPTFDRALQAYVAGCP